VAEGETPPTPPDIDRPRYEDDIIVAVEW